MEVGWVPGDWARTQTGASTKPAARVRQAVPISWIETLRIIHLAEAAAGTKTHLAPLSL